MARPAVIAACFGLFFLLCSSVQLNDISFDVDGQDYEFNEEDGPSIIEEVDIDCTPAQHKTLDTLAQNLQAAKKRVEKAEKKEREDHEKLKQGKFIAKDGRTCQWFVSSKACPRCARLDEVAECKVAQDGCAARICELSREITRWTHKTCRCHTTLKKRCSGCDVAEQKTIEELRRRREKAMNTRAELEEKNKEMQRKIDSKETFRKDGKICRLERDTTIARMCASANVVCQQRISPPGATVIVDYTCDAELCALNREVATAEAGLSCIPLLVRTVCEEDTGCSEGDKKRMNDLKLQIAASKKQFEEGNRKEKEDKENLQRGQFMENGQLCQWVVTSEACPRCMAPQICPKVAQDNCAARLCRLQAKATQWSNKNCRCHKFVQKQCGVMESETCKRQVNTLETRIAQTEADIAADAQKELASNQERKANPFFLKGQNMCQWVETMPMCTPCAAPPMPESCHNKHGCEKKLCQLRNKQERLNHGRGCKCSSGWDSRCFETVPLLRYFNGVDHFYTTNAAEIGTTTVGAVGLGGYKHEGVAGMVFAGPNPAAVPLYRYFNGKEHFYTTSADEIGTTTAGEVGKHNYKFEGIQCYVFPAAFKQGNPLYRYFNGVNHFYTTNAAEIGTTTAGEVGKHNYKFEGIQCYVFPAAFKQGNPLYRYFNGVNHFYTTNAAEIGTTTLGQTGQHGYIFEGTQANVL